MNLHYSTTSPLLQEILKGLMAEPIFDQFVLVGGTALSLKFGHRVSIDIDLFTEAEYRSIDFGVLENYLKNSYPYYDCVDKNDIVGFGRTYFIGKDEVSNIKLDLFYTDPFIRKPDVIDGIRIASTEDLIAMKMEVISNKGRKKDFWDLHYLINNSWDIKVMIKYHEERYPWNHNIEEIINNLTDFKRSDEDFDPICLLNKNWFDIKADFGDLISNSKL